MNAFLRVIENIDKVKISKDLIPAFIIALKEIESYFSDFSLLGAVDFDKFFDKYVICNGVDDENKMKFVLFSQTPDEIVLKNGICEIESEKLEKLLQTKQNPLEISAVKVVNNQEEILIENFFGKPYFISSKFLTSHNNGAFFEKENLVAMLPHGYHEHENNVFYKTRFADKNNTLAMLLSHELIHFLTIYGEIEFDKGKSHFAVSKLGVKKDFDKGKSHFAVSKSGVKKDDGQIKYCDYSNKKNFKYANAFCEIVADYLTSNIYNFNYTTQYSHSSQFIELIEFIYSYDCKKDLLQRNYGGFYQRMGKNVFDVVFSYLNDFTFSNNDIIQSKDYNDAIDVLLYFYKGKILSKNLNFEQFVEFQTTLAQKIPYATRFETKERINAINREFVVKHMERHNLTPITEYVDILTKKLSKATLLSLNNAMENKKNYDNIVTMDFHENKIAFGRRNNALYLTSQTLLNTHKLIPSLKIVSDLNNFNEISFDLPPNKIPWLSGLHISKLPNNPIIIANGNKNNFLGIDYKNEKLVFTGTADKELFFGKSNKEEQLAEIRYFFEEFVYLSKNARRNDKKEPNNNQPKTENILE